MGTERIYLIPFQPIGLVLVICYLALMLTRGRKKQTNAWKKFLGFAYFAYVLCVIAISLFPIPIGQDLVIRRYLYTGEPFYNVAPFATITFMLKEGTSNAYLNILGNIALFVPLGLLSPLLFRSQNRLYKNVLLGFSISFLIESCQFVISYILKIPFRSFDVDDILLNTIGALTGYMCFWIGKVALSRHNEQSRRPAL